MAIVVYGIPNCGTVKKARSFLELKGFSHQFVDFRQTPPPKIQVERWLTRFGSKAMRNTSGGSYRALGAEKESWTEAQWLDAFAADPMLIKRPVIEQDGRPVTVGFSEETLLQNLGRS